MPKRQDWTFKYTASEILTAAASRGTYHSGRLDHWVERQTVAEAELKESGLRIREAAAPGSTSNSYRGQPVWDNEKLKVFDEAQDKVREHQTKRDEYARWVQVLGRAGEEKLDLTVDDIAYFGL